MWYSTYGIFPSIAIRGDSVTLCALLWYVVSIGVSAMSVMTTCTVLCTDSSHAKCGVDITTYVHHF